MTSPAPRVRLAADHQLVIEWPDPRPDTFEIASDLFDALVVELNSHRRSRIEQAADDATVLRRVIRPS